MSTNTPAVKTAVIGYPRIGRNRELKFALEKYFRQEIDDFALENVAKQIQEENAQLMFDKGIDYVPSNDFSFYDDVLDMAHSFNLLAYRHLMGPTDYYDTYFAMARGYEGPEGSIKALPMKKFLNTNYHYIVPQLDNFSRVEFAHPGMMEPYENLRTLGFETLPQIIGPYSLVNLCGYKFPTRREDFIGDFIECYHTLLKLLPSHDVEELVLIEPLLVKDMDSGELRLLEQLYERIFSQKGSIKIYLQTVLGDLRSCYDTVINLNIDGLGLDFVDGKLNFELLKQRGLPSRLKLFAGLINGHNVWRNNYKSTLESLQILRGYTDDLVLNTSTSLQHVPYTVKVEDDLALHLKERLAFADEKLDELSELKLLSGLDDPTSHEFYLKNQQLFNGERKGNITNLEVQAKVQAITEEDTVRKPDLAERERLQKEFHQLPLLPTTTIGSFPQTAEVKKNRRLFRRGEISQREYEQFNRKKIDEVIKLQEELDLDVLVHGEFERNDMVEYFGENLEGFAFTKHGWVQSYGTRCVKPPIIYGDIYRRQPITVEWSAYAQTKTNRPVKGMLTGPVTILSWSFPREDISLKECALQIALAIKEEVEDLEKAGIRTIQVDEPALREKLPLHREDWEKDYIDWAIRAFRLVHSGLLPETQLHTHMCYSEFNEIIDYIQQMDADVIAFEASRSNLSILSALNEHQFQTQVGPGVYDIHSPRIPDVAEFESTIRSILRWIPPRKLWINPDCGLKTRTEEEVKQSLTNMVAAAKKYRNEISPKNIDRIGIELENEAKEKYGDDYTLDKVTWS